MKQELLKELMQITQEEQVILDGNSEVCRELYWNMGEFQIDNAKMMERGKYITVRTHTRFIDFPEHTHNILKSCMCARNPLPTMWKGGRSLCTACLSAFLCPLHCSDIADVTEININLLFGFLFVPFGAFVYYDFGYKKRNFKNHTDWVNL